MALTADAPTEASRRQATAPVTLSSTFRPPKLRQKIFFTTWMPSRWIAWFSFGTHLRLHKWNIGFSVIDRDWSCRSVDWLYLYCECYECVMKGEASYPTGWRLRITVLR